MVAPQPSASKRHETTRDSRGLSCADGTVCGHRVAFDPGGRPAARHHHPHALPLRRPGRAPRLPDGPGDPAPGHRRRHASSRAPASSPAPSSTSTPTPPPRAERRAAQPSTTSATAPSAHVGGGRRVAVGAHRHHVLADRPQLAAHRLGAVEQHQPHAARSAASSPSTSPRRRSVVTTRSPGGDADGRRGAHRGDGAACDTSTSLPDGPRSATKSAPSTCTTPCRRRPPTVATAIADAALGQVEQDAGEGRVGLGGGAAASARWPARRRSPRRGRRPARRRAGRPGSARPPASSPSGAATASSQASPGWPVVHGSSVGLGPGAGR